MLSVETRDFLGICVASTVAVALLVAIVAMLRRSPFTPIQSLLYAVNYTATRLLWRARIYGVFSLPFQRGAVLACNHRCPLDPSFITLIVPRAVHWMVAREYCEDPAFRWLLRTCEVIPVTRGGDDRAAIRQAIRLVEQGELVGVFPEGRINTTEQMLLPGRPGAAMIAMKARAPLIPCYIHGAPYDGTTLGCLFMPASVRINVGTPIDVSEYSDRADQRQAQDELTHRLLMEIARLGGQPNFQPQLAGRRHKTD